MLKRSCGVILPVTALPSEYGVGSLGRVAYEFIDFLRDAGQSWWQVLPLGPTGCGDSPYQSFSAFAGNPYLIDLGLLIRDGLLTEDEAASFDWGDDAGRVDYGRLYAGRFELLALACRRGWERERAAVEDFERRYADWLPDYALYMALKRHFGMLSWTEWPDEAARLRHPGFREKYQEPLREDIRLFTYAQFLFFRQWQALRAYAAKRGIGIIGDLPIYVARDSADVWARPGLFRLDSEGRPVDVAGVPPDYFSEDGQLWGNPLYDWEKMKEDGYAWWRARAGMQARLYDALRLDHFRGLESYWAVSAEAETAKAGRWLKGPGLELINAVREAAPGLELIAEDLGLLTPEVERLRRASGLPGMKVLEFAFDPVTPSEYLPHAHTRDCVCYTGTHDNPPLMAWREEASDGELALVAEYLGLNEKEGFNWGMLRGGMSSVATLFIAQLQDYLGLGAESRINTPGTLGGNWSWRLEKELLTPELAKKMARLAKIYGRAP